MTAFADPRLQGQRLADLRCGAAVCRATIEHAEADGAEKLHLGLFSIGAFMGTQINTVPVEGRSATTLYVLRPASVN